MWKIFIDADACPVKEEVYRVARRYGIPVVVVANAQQKIPADPLVELVVQTGFSAADDWIAGQAGIGDIAITSDIPLAARCVANQAVVLDPKGRLLNADSIGEVLAVRDLMDELRQAGTVTGGPKPMRAQDRSRFLSQLDEMVNAVLRVHPRKI